MSAFGPATASTGPLQQQEGGHAPAWAALITALIGLAGSLFLSLGLGLKACPLCFYQRTFMMSVAAVLGMGLLTRGIRPGMLCVLSLPLAVAGLGVAQYHVWLEATGKLECPAGVLGFGSAPQQSRAVFAVLVLFISLGVVAESRGRVLWVRLLASLVLGGLLGGASTIANPPAPPTPRQPYDAAPEICRPPFVEPRK